jgi:GT2 family glycosyltransferase
MTGYTRSMAPAFLSVEKTLVDVGLLDEGFFLYWEDTEFSLPSRKKGWRIAAAPESRVLHKVSASTSRNKILLDRYQTASDLPYCASIPLLQSGRRLCSLVFALHNASCACSFIAAAAWLQGFKAIVAPCACIVAYADMAY